MISFEQFQAQCPQKPDRENYDAFIRMSRAFRADHCDDYLTAKAIISHGLTHAVAKLRQYPNLPVKQILDEVMDVTVLVEIPRKEL